MQKGCTVKVAALLPGWLKAIPAWHAKLCKRSGQRQPAASSGLSQNHWQQHYSYVRLYTKGTAPKHSEAAAGAEAVAKAAFQHAGTSLHSAGRNRESVGMERGRERERQTGSMPLLQLRVSYLHSAQELPSVKL